MSARVAGTGLAKPKHVLVELGCALEIFDFKSDMNDSGHGSWRLGGTGAAGVNRTHDLPLTKGLRYHYATAARDGLCPLARCYNPWQRQAKERAIGSQSHTPREARLAAALKENLRRRKAQAKAKAEPATSKGRTLGIAPQADDALSGRRKV